MKTGILLLLLFVTGTAMAQKSDDGQEIIDKFFDLYKTRGYEYAVRYSWATNRWIPAGGEAVDNVVITLSKKLAGMGDFIGQELLKNRQVSSRFRVVSYLVYYERDPVRYTFSLYKNSQGWEVSNFQFDSDFEDEAEASLKLTAGN
jgi:hypothetical protein